MQKASCPTWHCSVTAEGPQHPAQRTRLQLVSLGSGMTRPERNAVLGHQEHALPAEESSERGAQSSACKTAENVAGN